jgi:hypothetical protein
MSTSSLFGSLLAQVESLDQFVSALRDRKGRIDSGELFAGLVILAGVLAGIVILARIFDPHRRKQPYTSPGRLLFSLCKAHGLRWSQWWLLRQIARHQAMEDPARLFVEPERLDPANAGPLGAAKRDQIQALRARLFSDLAEITRAPGGNMPAPEKGGPGGAAMPLFPASAIPTLDVPDWLPPVSLPEDFPKPAP